MTMPQQKTLAAKYFATGSSLQQQVGRVFSHQHSHVEDSSKPAKFLADEVGVLLNPCTAAKLRRTLVEGLAEVRAQHAGQDAFVHHPK